MYMLIKYTIQEAHRMKRHLIRFFLFVTTILLCACETTAPTRVVAVSPPRVVVAPLGPRVIVAPIRPWWAASRFRYWR